MSDEEKKEKTLLELYTEEKQKQEREKAFQELFSDDSDDDESFINKLVNAEKESVMKEFERDDDKTQLNQVTRKYRPRGGFTPPPAAERKPPKKPRKKPPTSSGRPRPRKLDFNNHLVAHRLRF